MLFIFTMTLTVIVHIHKPKEAYPVTRSVEDALVYSIYANGTAVFDVRSIRVFFLFCQFSLSQYTYRTGTGVEDVTCNGSLLCLLTQVTLEEDVWDYLDTTLIPSVYHTLPTGQADQSQFFLPDLSNALIGVPRIRQLRVDHSK